MTQQSTTPEVPQEILDSLTATSYVTHEDDYKEDGTPIWVVRAGGRIIATFDGDDDHENEQRAMQARGIAEHRVAYLASREGFTASLREFASFLDEHPDVPLPGSNDFRTHYPSAEKFDAAAELLAPVTRPHSTGDYETATRSFGAISFTIQTDGRKAQREALLAEREARIAERERELGLAVEDIAA